MGSQIFLANPQPVPCLGDLAPSGGGHEVCQFSFGNVFGGGYNVFELDLVRKPVHCRNLCSPAVDRTPGCPARRNQIEQRMPGGIPVVITAHHYLKHPEAGVGCPRFDRPRVVQR